MHQKIADLEVRIIEELKALGNPERAKGERWYFKETINPFGTGLPAMQKLCKSIFKEIKESYTFEEVFELSDKLLTHKIFEVTLIAFEILSYYTDMLKPEHISKIEKWINNYLVDNWAATDELGTQVTGEIIRKYPQVLPQIKSWALSENRWMRRSCAVSFIKLARYGLFLDEVYEIAEVLFEDKKDDLVQKANGWVLREAGKTDMNRLEVFLLKHNKNIPRTTLRYAIEKFDKEKKAELLLKTRGKTNSRTSIMGIGAKYKSESNSTVTVDDYIINKRNELEEEEKKLP